jgi:DNA-binding MarR family transcriptional regulator
VRHAPTACCCGDYDGVVSRRESDELSPAEAALVHTLTGTAVTMFAVWEADLMRRHGMSRIEFTVLQVLAGSPDHSAQLSPLADAAQQSRSAMSRTVGRLEGRGYVERHRCDADGRNARAVLTTAGLATYQEARHDHVTAVRRTLLDHLADVDVISLERRVDHIRTALSEYATTGNVTK